MGKAEDWTIERWRTEPRPVDLEFTDAPSSDPAPALWKDLTVASVFALLLWVAVVVLFR